MDASGNINALEEILELKPETIVGSRKTPFQLTQTSTDVQAAPSPDAPIVSTTYYRLNGVRVSQPTSGAYIEKTIYEDGYTSTKKVTKRQVARPKRKGVAKSNSYFSFNVNR